MEALPSTTTVCSEQAPGGTRRHRHDRDPISHALSRFIKTIRDDGSSVEQDYDEVGNVIRAEDDRGNAIHIVYNLADQVPTTTVPRLRCSGRPI